MLLAYRLLGGSFAVRCVFGLGRFACRSVFMTTTADVLRTGLGKNKKYFWITETNCAKKRLNRAKAVRSAEQDVYWFAH